MKSEIKALLICGTAMLIFFLFCNWFWSIEESILETIKGIGFVLITFAIIFRAKEDHEEDKNPKKA